MRCPNCSTESPVQAKFCPKCGRRLEPTGVQACSHCGAELPDQAKFCHACGTSVGGIPVSTPGSISASASSSTEALSSALQRMMPAQYVEKLLATKGHIEGERRVVTILFSDVKGSTAMAENLDPEEVMEIMNGAFEVLIEPIARYEGTLARLMGDAILAFFGAPIAHEDDPERACRSALDIMDGIRRYATRLQRERNVTGFNVRVGINTGLVVVGEVGADLRVEYTAMGDAVNLAARMESAAEPGSILITESTYKLVSYCFETEALDPIKVKGKTDPVCTFRLLRLKSEPGSRRFAGGLYSPLVGRDSELQQVRTAIAALQAGRGGRVAIVGEAGLGKSRLVAEARQSSTARVTWVESRALAYTQGMSFWMARNLLYSLLDVRSEAPAAKVEMALSTTVERLCNGQGQDIYPYLARLLDVPVEEALEQRIKHLDAEALQRRIHRAFREYIKLQSLEQPLILELEDLHWVDPSSLTLFEAILAVSDEAPVLFLLVFRLEEGRVGDFHNRNLRAYGQRYQVIELTPLTRPDSALLVDNLLKARNLAPEIREQILDKAEGNALFLEEVLRSMLDAGVVLPRADRKTPVESFKRIQVPNSLQSVIMARIDRLFPEDKRTLQTASVIGRVFQKRLLVPIMGSSTPDHRLENSLSELQRREFLRPRVPDTLNREVLTSEEEFIFKHSLTQDVAYNTLLLTQRKGLHRRVGEAIEGLFLNRLDELAATLASHFERAELNDKALTYLIKAANRAKNVFANQEAIDFYLRALRLVGESEARRNDVAQVHEGLGDVYALRAKYASAQEHYDEAVHQADNPHQRAVLNRKRGQVYEKWGRYDEAIDCFKSALKEIREQIDAIEAARIYTGMGLVYYRRGELDPAIELSNLALGIMEKRGDQWGVAEACNNLGIIYSKKGDLEKALEFHERCLSIWKSVGDTYGLAASHNNLGLVYSQQSDWDEAVEHYRQSLELCEKIGNRHGLARTYDNLSQVYANQGQQEEAMDCLKKAVSILAEIGMDSSEVVPEMWQQSGAW